MMLPMAATAPLHAPEEAPKLGEHRIVLYGVSWAQYVAVREALDRPGLHMTYLKGTLEIMSPSRDHERIKKLIARLIELWSLARGVKLQGYGETTYRKEEKERGLEADECYYLGDESTRGEFPDLAIEVALTSGGIDKLAVYQGLGVREVWIWRKGRLELFHLRESNYARVERSVLLPDLDVESLARHVAMPDQADAARAWWDALSREK
jgi:Uma2 family endonuclease